MPFILYPNKLFRKISRINERKTKPFFSPSRAFLHKANEHNAQNKRYVKDNKLLV